MSEINFEYELWLKNATRDEDLIAELKSIAGNEQEIQDRFYKSLEFGTGGLRGVIGAGTNRMNIYTVGQATQGLANLLNCQYDEPSVAIGYDSRIKSKFFAETAAGVLAANNIKVYIYPELMPTPMVSFAVRRLGCSSGIVLTASHNPSKYNGYKCYDERGYQMTDENAAKTLDFIKDVNIFSDIKFMDFDDALAEDKVDFIEDWLIDEFYDEVLKLQVEKGICKKANLNVIYSPLNGTGNKPVRTILKKIGVKNLKVVKTQEKPDGTFPTCPFPNPEIRQVFEEGLKMTEEFDADLLLATDPDCDRVGIAVKHDGEYILMTGNEVGCMLTEYILSRKKAQCCLPEDACIVKTIVTSELIRFISNDYGATVYDLLTGFKYIGELVQQKVEQGKGNTYMLGMEESYGYLSGTHVREKDAVNASMLIVEMASYYKSIGKDLFEVMDDLYKKYGYFLNSLLNFGFEGEEGMIKMNALMEQMRNYPPTKIAEFDVVKRADYLKGVSLDCAADDESKIDLPSSNVLQFDLQGNNKIIIRPSGTEPKIKIYVTAVGKTKQEALEIQERLSKSIEEILGLK